MTTHEGYAQALFGLVSADPQHADKYLKNLRGVLERKNQVKLFPKIFTHYQTISSRAARFEKYRARTPKDERARALVELYRNLIATN